MTREEFERALAEGGFLEHTEFLGNYYGTPLPDPARVPAGSDLVLEIEVDGASQVKRLDPTALLIFVVPPSAEEQERRLRGRGDPEEIVVRRLAKAADEIDAAAVLGAFEVVNDDLDEAVDRVHDLITAARTR